MVFVEGGGGWKAAAAMDQMVQGALVTLPCVSKRGLRCWESRRHDSCPPFQLAKERTKCSWVDTIRTMVMATMMEVMMFLMMTIIIIMMLEMTMMMMIIIMHHANNPPSCMMHYPSDLIKHSSKKDTTVIQREQPCKTTLNQKQKQCDREILLLKVETNPYIYMETLKQNKKTWQSVFTCKKGRNRYIF